MKFGKLKSHQNQETNGSDVQTENVNETQEQSKILSIIGADGIATISLSGKIDALCFAEIQEKAVALLDQENVVGIVFDMKNVSYVSSAGLRMFSAVHKKSVSAGKSYKLTQIRGDILKLFQMTGYASAFCLEMQEEE